MYNRLFVIVVHVTRNNDFFYSIDCAFNAGFRNKRHNMIRDCFHSFYNQFFPNRAVISEPNFVSISKNQVKS